MAYKRISPMPVIEGGTGIQSATVYAPLTGGTTTTNPFQSASTGQATAGFVLTSTGSSSLPTWQANSAGGSGSLILLNTQTISGPVASIVFNDSYITSTYQVYFVLFSNILNATASVNFQMDWSTNNGSTYLNSGYFAGNNYSAYNSASYTNTNSTATNILTASLGSSHNLFGYLYLNLPSSSFYPSSNGNLLDSTSPADIYITSSTQTSAVVVNTIKFSYSSGNITNGAYNGTISLYGLKQ